MHFSDLDAYFHMATQGDTEAFTTLYNEINEKARKQIRLIKNSVNFTGNSIDFTELIDRMFFKILNEFDSDRGTFSSFVEFVLSNRFAARVKTVFANNSSTYASLNNAFEDTTPIEALSDPNQVSMRDDIAINQFKYRIASKGRSRSNLQRLRDKIVILQYAGYSNIEICKLLKMSYSQLRTHLIHIKKHEDVINLKLELK